jgi:L,D-transpeptidase ErfK/SrfK
MGDPLPFVVPPGPQNPLGHLALQLGVPGYFIHGTNKPFGVGQMVSHGCIRLYRGHIETLVGLVPNGTPVYVVNEPYKVGWRSGKLYAEAHKDLYAANRRTDLVRKIIVATERATESAAEDTTHDDGATSISWQRVDKLGVNLTGVPVRVSG